MLIYQLQSIYQVTEQPLVGGDLDRDMAPVQSEKRELDATSKIYPLPAKRV
jgi:hypothetical protein